MADFSGELVSVPTTSRTSEGVAQIIRAAILGGELAPGASLRERRLAEELEVSRTPVREALFTLQGEGLVELTPGRAARVRRLDIADIAHLYRLRGLLEGFAAACAARRRDEEMLGRVREALAAQRQLGQNVTATEQARAYLAFHEAIAEAAGSPLLLTLVRQVLAVTMVFRAGYRSSSARTRQVLRQHGGILKAISMGSPAEAEALMAAHVADAAELVLRTLKKRAGNER